MVGDEQQVERIAVWVTSAEDQPHGHPEKFKLTCAREVHAVHQTLDIHAGEWELRHHRERYQWAPFAEEAWMRRYSAQDANYPFRYEVRDQDGTVLTAEDICVRGGNTAKTIYTLVMQ